MDILQLLQTIGICVGAVALVAIALMMFLVISTFMPSVPKDLPPESEDDEDIEPYVVFAPPMRRRGRGRPSSRKKDSEQ
jgi:hypothetical protein